jgi:hypothetical protein
LAARQKNATMKSKYQIGLILLLLLTNLCGFSQDDHPNLGLTLDLGGNSGGYSVNGEYQIFNHDHYKVNARLGFGYLPIKGTNFLGIPIGVNLLTGNKKHHIEFGVGASYIKGLSFITIDNAKYYPSNALYFVPSIGYRYDKLIKGLIFKAYYSPLIVIRDFIDKNKIINDVTKDVVLSGSTTREDYFNYFYGDNFLPIAKSKYGYFGISVGYRF